jgi:hypothetical protein
LARLEKDFETNPPFKAEPEMALLFFLHGAEKSSVGALVSFLK